jgi:hypothetical protein
MDPTRVFALQFVLSSLAWISIARWFVLPWLKAKRAEESLPVLIVPQLFRHIGATLLVSTVVSPSLPAEFAYPTAIGDTITAALALLSLAALKSNWRGAFVMVWIFNIFGSVDMLHGLVQGARLGAAPFLQAAWIVPTFGVPMMLTVHFLIFYVLTRTARQQPLLAAPVSRRK